MAKILIFTIGYYGSWIQEKVIVTCNFKTICFTIFLQNMEVHRTIMYEIQRPKEAKLKKHPDVSSLEVVSARASLNLSLTIDIFYISTTISTDTFQKQIHYAIYQFILCLQFYTMGFLAFEALRFLFPIIGGTRNNFLNF
jgi:hypothetical protein